MKKALGTDLARTRGGLLVGTAWFTTTPEQLAAPCLPSRPATIVLTRRNGEHVRRSTSTTH